MKAHLAAGLLMAALTMAPSLQAQDSSGVRLLQMATPNICFYSLLLQDNTAFLSTDSYSMRIYDVSDLDTVEYLGWGSLSGTAFDFHIRDDYLFAACGSNGVQPAGLRVVDISDLSHPQPLALLDSRDGAYGLARSGDYLYLGTGSYLQVYDISDPARPDLVSEIRPGGDGYAYWLALSGEYLYVAGIVGIHIFDVSNPTEPRRIGFQETPSLTMRLAVNDDYVYAADVQVEQQGDRQIYTSNLRIIDVSDPESPQQVGIFGELDQYIYGITYHEGYVYLAAITKLIIVDVSDPENPTEAGWYLPANYSVFSVQVRPPIAFVAQSNGLGIYDISNALGQPDLVIAEDDLAHDFGQVVAGLSDSWELPLTNAGHYQLTVSGMEVDNEAFVLRSELSQWRWQEGFPAGPAASDQRLNGVEFVGDCFYVTGGDDGDMTPQVYVFNREGELVDEFDQFAESPWGMRDLAWDGDLLWGADGRTVFGFTTAGELTAQFEGPLETTRSIAWDPARELLWLCDLTSPIYGVDREGNVVVELEAPGVRTYGAAWYPEDPDGFNLYLLTWTPDHPVSLHKVNVETGELREVRSDLEARIGERSGGGLAITNELNPPGWDLVALLDGAQDAVETWQITDFYRGEEILVPADEQAEMVVGFSPAEARDYEGALTIRSDDPEEPEIVIQLTGSGRENRAPEWANLPEAVEADEGELVEFTVSGSDPDGSPLTIKLERPDLPYAARLEDQGDGSALFSWQTDYNDEGEYTAQFNLSDGVANVDAEVPITVVNVVSAPDVANTPLEYRLYAPRPNPFNAAVTLRFDLPQAVQTTLKIYDLTGAEVLQLADGVTAPGSHQFIWDAGDYPGGLYIARLTTPLGVRTAKLALVR